MDRPQTIPNFIRHNLTIYSPQTPWEKLKDAWERAKRRRNKSRGLPATEEVGTIANVLIQLRAMAEESLGHSINATVAATPPLPGLTEEDLDDAMEYAGLKLVRRYNFYGPVHEAAAAIAGAGHGLCADPKDIESCEDEERYMRGFGLLSLSFTDFLLSLEWDVCSAAHRCWVIRTEPNFGLGLRYRYLYPDPVVYWNEVHKWIYEFVRPNAQGIDRLQLLGDKASNEDFLDALRHALRDLEPKLAVTLDESEKLDPLSLAAKGAAEFAKRFQEMTWGCKESLQCNETEIVENPVAEL
jgi:hypothetical protein